MDEESKTQLSPYLRLYKTNEETKEFCSKCVYKIANIIYATIEEQKTKDGAEAYKDSKFYAPRDNLRNTVDKNILVIGKGDSKGAHIFENVIDCDGWETRIIEYKGWENEAVDLGDIINCEDAYWRYYDENIDHEGSYPHEIIYHKIPIAPIDAAQGMAKHLINLMKVQHRKGYEGKICHIKWDSYSNNRGAEWIYSYKIRDWYHYCIKSKNEVIKYGIFTSLINDLLYKTYPDIFPLLDGENGKKIYTVFWNKEMRKKDINKIQERIAKEQKIRDEIIEEERRKEEAAEEERIWREMERSDFWDELGESSVNIIDC